MISQANRRWAFGFIAVAAAYLLSFYVVPAFLSNSDGQSRSEECIPYQKVGLDHGEHQGIPWRISASIEKIERKGRCPYWFLKVKFSPKGLARGSWIEGWSVPVGGHLPLDATIDAYEAEDGRSLGGVVGAQVRSVVLEMSGGRTIVVHPKDPREILLQRFVWLRNLRFFFSFQPAGEHVTGAKLLNGKGKVIHTIRSQEGELNGNMVY
jgi:hypothetical protein